MARRKLIAGNWKLYKTVPEALALVTELKNKLASVRDCDIAVAPPYTALYAVRERLSGSNIALAAQEVFYEDQGAFTGAVSAPMLKDVGCTYVLVGHSERRQHFGESLESSNKRVRAVLKSGLVPILCIGETLPEREASRTMNVVAAQLDAALEGRTTSELASLVVAYEPVWAIGTGKVATPAQAQEVHAFIRERLRSKGAELSDNVRLLYGGSVKPDNAKELLSQRDIDGALVGGASLDAASFVGIVKARA
jgi:triosephosphate isomerase (TIM)